MPAYLANWLRFYDLATLQARRERSAATPKADLLGAKIEGV
jgi:hypothetical protein